MTRLVRILGQVASLALAAAAKAQDIPLRLMPLGASITNGVGSSTGNGYRQFLLDRLNGAGYTVDYVGSQQSGDMADRDNEGFPGLRIDEVQQRAEEDVPGYLPNVYAINVGTNDAAQDFDVGSAGARMGELLGYLWEATPGATVLLSTLIINLNADTETRAQDINAQYVGLAEQLAGEGRRIVLVDLHGDEGPLAEDMDDATHPNDVGFDKMAELWFRGVQLASAAGFIQPAP